jgi:phenylacetate-CoA ligase
MARDAPFYDADEGRPHHLRVADQEARLRRIVASAVRAAPAVRAALEHLGRAPADIRLADLPRLPLLRKERLPAVQAEMPPFGGWLGAAERLRRIFVSPGPIYDPEADDDDYWGFAPALHAAGFRSGDIVLNTFSYHFTPAGSMFDGALAKLRCVVVPAGVGNLEVQVKTVLDLGARGFIGTPSFLASVLERISASAGRSPLQVAFVSGEPLAESLRADLEARGARVSQGYATGDVGLIANECPARSGLHLADRVIVELVDPATGAPVAEGEAGEVAVTFPHELYPLLRLATGDLSRLTGGSCACGRTSPRLSRILGRVGDAVKVRGLFLHPLELERAMAQHPEVVGYEAVVSRGADHQDALTVRVEVRPDAPADLPARVAQSIRETTRLRAVVAASAPGSIPAGAKRIEDRRTWD